MVLPMAIPSRSASNSLKCEWLAPSYFVRASRPAPERRSYPYLLEKIRVTRPNQAWAADITYLPMARGFLYLVAIMDWHSRYVVAWRLSNSLEADFCVDALKEALEQGQPEVFNTDQATLRERRKMSLPHNGP